MSTPTLFSRKLAGVLLTILAPAASRLALAVSVPDQRSQTAQPIVRRHLAPGYEEMPLAAEDALPANIGFIDEGGRSQVYSGDAANNASDNATVEGNATADEGKNEPSNVNLVCPGEYRQKEGFSHPRLCATAKKQPNCSWSDSDLAVGAACGTDCFCGESYMDLNTCKSRCQKESCVFTYTSEGGCLVYDGCTEHENPNNLPNATGMSDNWITCERFFSQYYDKVVSLHSEAYNRMVILAKDNRVTRTHSEIGLTETNRVTAGMQWIVTPSEGLAEAVAARFGGQGTDSKTDSSAQTDTAKTSTARQALVESIVGELHKTAATGAPATAHKAVPKPEHLDEGDDDESLEVSPGDEIAGIQFSGGAGIIALMNNNNNDGQMWLSMDIDGNMVMEDKFSDRALFTVCYIAPNTVALHNKLQNRYVMMGQSRMGSSAQQDCCTVPEGDLWKGTHFQIVLPPRAPTGSEDDATNNEDDSDLD